MSSLGQHRCRLAVLAAMAALQQQSPEEALVDKVLGAEQPTGRLYRGLITALRDDAETAEGLAAARKILKALAARAPALAEDRHARLWRALCDAISQSDGLLAERAFCLREVVSANATRVKDALDGIARAAAADADDVMRTGLAQCLADVVERCPQGRAEVTSSVRKAWPYVNAGEETHDGYTRFVIDALRCCDDKGPLLTTCVERALALDCAAAQQVFAMDEDEAKDAAADKVVSRLIAYVAKTCVSDTDAELLLQATLGPCLATPRAQTAPFVVFAAAAPTPTRAAAFCRTLSSLVSDEATADARRAAAIAYLSSFVCRAAVVDAGLVALACATLFERCRRCRELFEAGDKHLAARRHVDAARGLLYVFAFRGEEILGRRGWDARCDAVCAPKSWDAALGIRAPAALDALRGCRARLLGEFARVAAREPPFLSRAAAARVREARRDATEAADDGLFFPFDPCRLPRTKAAVAALFREWAAAEAEESSSSSSDDESGSSDDDAAPMSLATSLHEQDEAW